jgi:hypothetical protein
VCCGLFREDLTMEVRMKYHFGFIFFR